MLDWNWMSSSKSSLRDCAAAATPPHAHMLVRCGRLPSWTDGRTPFDISLRAPHNEENASLRFGLISVDLFVCVRVLDEFFVGQEGS
jgi:hypothetical protein